MRVSSCKCHYPLVCCSKSSFPPRPPKSQCRDAQNVSSSTVPVPIVLEEKPSDKNVMGEHDSVEDGKVEILLKSSLKKPGATNSEKVGKGNVKWMDLSGKELVEIKEFEIV